MPDDSNEKNPYASPFNPSVPSKSVGRRNWLEWLGIACLTTAVLSFAITILMFGVAANSISSSSVPSPSKLANGIHLATTVGYVVMPLGLIGLSLFVAGQMSRKHNQ